MNSSYSQIRTSTSCFLLAAMLFSCGTRQKAYNVVSMAGSREAITDKYDKSPDKAMKDFVACYKAGFDREMKVRIAVSDQEMVAGRPESLLTNFTSDQMKRYADDYTHGNSDLALMNVHGHRSGLPKGAVTLEDIYEIYPFDNKLVIVKLKGSDLTKIFESYIRMKGAGISSNVRLAGIGSQLQTATVDGKPVYADKTYSIVTLDYLADGNDGMEDLKKAVSVEYTGVTLRDMMIGYVKDQARQGKNLHASLDGRIIISEPAVR